MVDNELIAVKMRGFSRMVKAGRNARKLTNDTATYQKYGSSPGS